LEACDHAIASTPLVAERMRRFINGQTYVVENCLDETTLAIAGEIASGPRRPHRGVVIGYGTGTRTHDADFEVVAGALAEVISRYSDLRLALHGEVKLPDAFDAASERVDRIPFLAAEDYLPTIATPDVSIAPPEPSVVNH